MIGAVAAVAIGATTAFFSDTETSRGNTFTAGAIDLKIDSTCHWSGGDTGSTVCPWSDANWQETDLGTQKFFSFNDIKPGDWGENTISIHVHDNDAWGSWGIANATSSEGTCTEPETETQALGINPHPCVPNATPGQLGDGMTGRAWLDQGGIPGFQCNNPNVPETAGARCPRDPFEGDNVWQENSEPVIASSTQGTPIRSFFDVFTDIDLAEPLALEASLKCQSAVPDGHNGYEVCHGLAWDGRLVGSVTYYIGWKWHLDPNTGNEAQTDTLGGDVWFKAVQHRNNPGPT